MFSLPVSLCVVISSLLSIIGDKPANRTLHYVFKPLTMLILIAGAIGAGLTQTPFVYWLLLGLCLSLVGDVFLMLPSDKFIQGLASFLLAHIAYIVAFYQLYDGSVTLIWLGGVITFSCCFFMLLAKNLGKLKGPVIVYIMAISSMVWLAGELYFQQASLTHLMLLIGAIIFAVSDASLAWNKFKQPFSWAQWLILSTYFAAQWCLVQAMLTVSG